MITNLIAVLMALFTCVQHVKYAICTFSAAAAALRALDTRKIDGVHLRLRGPWCVFTNVTSWRLRRALSKFAEITCCWSWFGYLQRDWISGVTWWQTRADTLWGHLSLPQSCCNSLTTGTITIASNRLPVFAKFGLKTHLFLRRKGTISALEALSDALLQIDYYILLLPLIPCAFRSLLGQERRRWRQSNIAIDP